MKEIMKTVVLFPLILGLALAVVHKALADWKYASALVWVVFLVLMAGVWVPLILLPHLRRTQDDL